MHLQSRIRKKKSIYVQVWDQYACSGYVRAPKESGATHTNSSRKIQNIKTRNVLYIVIDDLRNELEAYGQNFTWNPNIKKLSETGTTFDNAYCQIAVCSPRCVNTYQETVSKICVCIAVIFTQLNISQ